MLATGHADRPGASECGIVRAKCLCYLTATSADGGAIRTIPGSHANPLHENLRRIQAAHPLSTASDRWADVTYGTLGSELPCSVVEAAPGDAVLLHGSTYHAVCEHAATLPHAVEISLSGARGRQTTTCPSGPTCA